LAVGYLWLTAAWLWRGDDIPEQSEATGLVALVYRLVGGLGVTGSFGVLTFVAYVLGSVVSWQHLVYRVTAHWDLRSGGKDPERVFASNRLRRAGMGFIRERAVEDVRDHLLKRIDHALESRRHTMPDIARIAKGREEPPPDRDKPAPPPAREEAARFRPCATRRHLHLSGDEPASPPPREEPPVPPGRDAVAAMLYRRLANELPELVTRLALLEKDRLWDTYDRQIAEAEFRQAVSLPLSVVIVVIAVVGPAWAALGLVVPALFLVQGMRRAQEARSEVFLAVVQGIIHSYVLDLVGDVPDETRVGVARDRWRRPARRSPRRSAGSPARHTRGESKDIRRAAPGQGDAGAAMPVAADQRAAVDVGPVQPHGRAPRS
jgi:hypothetical protein